MNRVITDKAIHNFFSEVFVNHVKVCLSPQKKQIRSVGKYPKLLIKAHLCALHLKQSVI